MFNHSQNVIVWLCRREGWEVGRGVGGMGLVEGNRGMVGLSDLHIFVLPLDLNKAGVD